MSAADKVALPMVASAGPISGVPDLKALRRPQNFGANLGVKKLLTQLSVRTPYNQWFSRVRAGDEWRAQIAAIVLKDPDETYALDPDLAPDLPHGVKNLLLVTAINRQGVPFLWRLREPSGSHHDSWALSALAASVTAETQWVRVTANMSAQAFDVCVATAAMPEPEWPEVSFEELFRLAFRDRVISSVDHPVLRQLKGTA